MKDYIYLDNAATTPLKPQVMEAMEEASLVFGNPSSQHALGRKAHALIEDARRSLGEVMGYDPKGLIFTSGATESDNLAIRSLAKRARKEGRNHLITSMTEHPAVYETFKHLAQEGFDVTFLDPQEKGAVSAQQLAKALRDDTGLVSLMQVNNETGAITELEDIVDLLQGRDIFFHTDAVQGFGKLPLAKGLDAITITAHKLGGPKGVGALWMKTAPQALVYGGHQERDARPGTENTMGIVGFAKAAALVSEATDLPRLEEQRKLILEALNEAGINYHINEGEKTYPAILNLWFPNHRAMQLLIRLDLQGICVSAGSACSAGSLEPSRILQSLRPGTAAGEESLRISFTSETSVEELLSFVKTLAQIMKG